VLCGLSDLFDLVERDLAVAAAASTLVSAAAVATSLLLLIGEDILWVEE
jgi:hypothetical protein